MQRDPDPKPGEIRWNTTSGQLEFYNGSGYSEVASRGNVTITKDSFTGDGSTAAYVLSLSPVSANNILVFVGNVYQEPTINYTLAGAVLTFTSAPPLAQNIVVLHGFDSTGNATDPPSVMLVTHAYALSDEFSILLTGAGKLTTFVPYDLTVNEIILGVATAPTGSAIIVDINKNDVSIFSTRPTIDIGELTSLTATAAVISSPSFVKGDKLTFDIDQVGSTVTGAGLKVWLNCTRV